MTQKSADLWLGIRENEAVIQTLICPKIEYLLGI
jgi:hypothetical protein